MPLLLAQLGDALDGSTWFIILFVGLASPILGCLLGCTKPVGRLDRVKWAAVYCVALGLPVVAMFLMGGESAGAFIIFLLLLLCGPILGLVLMLVPGERL